MSVVVDIRKRLDPYTNKGYKDRMHYLQCLSKKYDVDLDIVHHISAIFGPAEDFTVVVDMVKDHIGE